MKKYGEEERQKKLYNINIKSITSAWRRSLYITLALIYIWAKNNNGRE